jgi:hypothetical protein
VADAEPVEPESDTRDVQIETNDALIESHLVEEAEGDKQQVEPKEQN